MGRAVLVWVVAPEDDVFAVCGGDLVEPADDGAGWTGAKVFLVEGGGVAVDQDWCLSVTRYTKLSHSDSRPSGLEIGTVVR